jgi:hypothetical protein
MVGAFSERARSNPWARWTDRFTHSKAMEFQNTQLSTLPCDIQRHTGDLEYVNGGVRNILLSFIMECFS